jgi:hypothetical protein
MGITVTFIFVDTNVLLHFKRLEDIDWCAIANTSQVTVVLCPVVIRELEKQKAMHPQGKIRKRAQALASNLYSRLAGTSSPELRPDVRLEFVSHEPNVDFVAHKLRSEIADDWLIASVLGWTSDHPQSDARLASADMGLLLKARAHRIAFITPPDSDRLPDPADDEEKQLRELQRELTELKNSQPILSVRFAEGQGHLQFKLSPPLPPDAEWVESQMHDVRAKHPLLTVPSEPTKPAQVITAVEELQRLLLAAGPNAQIRWPRNQVLRHNEEVTQFYSWYEEYFRELREFDNVHRRIVRFALYLRNSGTRPAEDVDVALHFPDGFSLFEDEDDEGLPALPTPPRPPAKIGTFGSLIGQSIANMPPFPVISPPYVGPRNVSSLSIRKTNSYDVEAHVRKAKHGHEYDLGLCIALFDSLDTAKSFKISYSISAANLPKPTRGELSVVIEKS